MNRKPELIAPAGNFECARAAVANGADAVYFGLPRFNARMRADNFTAADLPELVRFLHAHGVRALAAFNTLVFTHELPEAEQQWLELEEAGVDAVIVQDLGLAVLARELGSGLEVHASTQMTITSPEGLRFAAQLGIRRTILARELSLPEIARCCADDLPGLEVFVHGALCVAYSGQCLTSEALGQRSANRGECAQACRLPYGLVVDGILKDLGDRRYLLSPRDLAAVREIPELTRLGVVGFKIEGRLKSPEYVAAATQVYRKAIDAAWENPADPVPASAGDWYQLEMAFSRGLSPGWLHGVNHQQLVQGRFGTKRGPLAGWIKSVGPDYVELTDVPPAQPADGLVFNAGTRETCPTSLPLRPGDGVVFDTGGDPEREQGGRIWQVQDGRMYFERGHIAFDRLQPGNRIWKTSDPQLERVLRRTFQGELPPRTTRLDLTVTGTVGRPLTIESGGVRVSSSMPLQAAAKRPLTDGLLREQLGRLGGTAFELGDLRNEITGEVILPISELNRLRRQLVAQLESARASEPVTQPVRLRPKVRELLEAIRGQREEPTGAPDLVALCRNLEQIGAALEAGCSTVYADFEDPRRYAEAVDLVRGQANLKSQAESARQAKLISNLKSPAAIFLATPRIQKAGEQGLFKAIDEARPDGVLVRNLGGLEYYRNSALRRVGDFSLNVANPLTAALLKGHGLERLTVAYDLNAQQVLDLLQAAPPAWFELTVHQHLPLFHMDHCVFAAFLGSGTDASNCGRPCDRHQLKLRDRVGLEHPVKADVGCRNTVFHARPQSGADYLRSFVAAGARVFRVELLDEDAERSRLILKSYRELIDGVLEDPAVLLRRFNVVKQLGVTSGTLTVLG